MQTRQRQRWMCGFRPGARAALIAVACLFLGAGQAAGPEDLPPLRRVLVPPGRVLNEMKGAGQGRLESLSRDEFEELVQRAARAAESVKKQPRLVESHYRARLTDNALTGTGLWKVLHPGSGAAVLPLPHLNLAVRQPRFENRAALLAEFDGKTPGLLLEQGGEQSVALDWSGRGERRPEGLLFALEVPASPIASLELDVPADQAVSVVSDGCLLAGPDLAESAQRRLWKIGFAGRTEVRLIVHPADDRNQRPPLVLAGLTTRQQVTPDAVDAEFIFDLRALHQSVTELRCEYTPALRPYRVVLDKPTEDVQRPLETWQLIPGSEKSPSLLIIHLPEPLQAGTLQIHALAPLGGTGGTVTWTCPGMRLLQAAPRGESLELRLHPDVQLEQWQPGGFRLNGSRTEANGWQVLTLSGGGLANGPEVRRPGARIHTHGVDFWARQLLWWQVAVPPAGEAATTGAAQSSLTAQLTYEVSRGRLFQMPVALPPGWEVDRLQLTPTDLLRNWNVLPEKGRQVLLVELQKPVGPTAAGTKPETARNGLLRLTVWLRPLTARQPGAGPTALTFPFPDMVPLGARWREGALAIDYDQARYDAHVQTAARSTPPNEEGPWGKQVLDYYYPYRGQPVQGTLALQARRPRARARCTSAVGLTAKRAAIVAHLTLQPEVGTPETVDLYFSAPLAGKWEWKTEEGGNAVRRFERLPALEAVHWLGMLGSGHALETIGWAAFLTRPPAVLRGEHWRMTLAHPLREPLTLAGTSELARRPGRPEDSRIDIPLLTVAGAERLEGEVKLYLAGANLVQVEAVGLHELSAPASNRGNASPPWRVFHYGPPPLALTLRGLTGSADLAPRPAIDHARLTTYAGPDGRLVQHYRFQVWNWQQRTVPLRLPAGARVLAAQVDGRRITQLVTEAIEPDAADGVLVELPVPGPAAPHRYEVVYAVDRPAWTLWSRLEAPAPSLPLELKPLTFRRAWLLAPGVAPLQGSQRRLPGSAAQTASLLSLEGWNLRHWLGRLGLAPTSGSEWQKDQRQRLEDASLGLGKPEPGKPRTLGPELERLVIEQLRDQDVLIVDMEALQAEGIDPGAPLPAATNGDAPRPFWEELGLVVLPCSSGPLLTTRRQALAWQSSAGEALVQAVAEAVLHGHDRSGRFADVPDWLQRAASGETGEAGETLLAQRLVPETPGPGWTEWEPLAGTVNEETLLIVRQDALPGVGITLAALLGLGCWRLRRQARLLRLGFLLAWLATAGLALLWLPLALQPLAWWPLLAVVGVGGGWYLGSALRRVQRKSESGSGKQNTGSRPRPGSSMHRKTASGLGPAIALGLALLPAALSLAAGPAPGPEPTTVYIVPGPSSDPEKQTVLAPPALLKQLQALAQRGTPVPRAPVLVDADYKGEVVGDTVHFEAVLAVQAFTEEPAPLPVPLAGVQLEEALFDGARAAPLAAPAGQTGYVMTVKGKGSHVLTLRFRVPVQTSDADRNVQLTVPRVVQCRLGLTVPAGAQYLQALVKQGRAALDPKGNHLEVDLGRVTAPLHFRWRQENGTPPAPVVKVQELYLWELGGAASSLNAVLQYTVASGAVRSLAVDLPEQIGVRGIEVGPLGTEEPKPRLLAWHLLSPAQPRRLQLDFQTPITTGMLVFLDLVPRRPLARHEELVLPTPVAAEPTKGYLAYRLDGLKDVLKTYLRVRQVEPAEFTQLWRTARAVPPGPLSYACVFVRRPAAPALGLDLEPQETSFEAVQDLAWLVGPQQADLRATLHLTAPDGDLSLVEWELPNAVTVARISGPDVRCWNRAGPRVQVWLQRAVSATDVQLTGWWLPPKAAEPAKKTNPPPAPLFTFELPRLGLPTAQSQTTLVHLTAAGGLALHRVKVQHLGAWPDSQPSEQEYSYVSRRPDYAGSFRVEPAAVGLETQVLTLVEVHGRQLTFTAVVQCRARQGELRTLTLRLRHWDGDKVTLKETSEIAQVQERRRGAGERGWLVELRPGVSGRCRFELSGSLPLEEAVGGISMPEVSLTEAARSERWLVVRSRELTAQDGRGVATIRNPAAVLRAWPEEARRVQGGKHTVWQVTADDWDLRLLPRSRDVVPAPIQVFLSEHRAAVVDGHHWVHQATYWLYHEASTDLNVTLPQGAVVLEAAVDGMAIAPLQPNPAAPAVWLPLPGGTGARRICLRWAFPSDEARLDRPNLNQPRLEGVADGPAVWTVHVPPGYSADAAGRMAWSGAQPLGRAGLDLRRAEAQLHLSKVLARQLQSRGDAFAAQLAAAQRRFYEHLRDADYWLTTSAARTALRRTALRWPEEGEPASATADRGPQGQELGSWLQELEEENRKLAQAGPSFEALRAEAQRQARAAGAASRALPSPEAESEVASGRADLFMGRSPGPCEEGLAARGTPLYWYAADSKTPSPALHLTAAQARQTLRALAGSLMLMGLIALLAVLACWPALLLRVQAFWPELVLLLGGVGWLIVGLNPFVVALLVVGVIGRLVWLGHRGLAHLQSSPVPAPVPGNSASTT